MEFMTARIMGHVPDMTHEQWLEVRRTGIGGSDASTLMGHNRFNTPEGLFLSKTGQDDADDADGDNAATYWGKVLEPVVADEFGLRNRMKVLTVPYMLQSVEYPFMLANLDRLILPEGCWALDAADFVAGDLWLPTLEEEATLLECKTTAARYLRDWSAEEPPTWVVDQVTHYLVVTGLAGAWVACLVGGRNWQQFYVPLDEAYAEEIIRAEADFWAAVQGEAGIPLAPARVMIPEGPSVELPPEVHPHITRLVELEEEAVRVAAEQKRLRAIVKRHVGLGQQGLVGGSPLIEVSARGRVALVERDQ